MNIQKLGAEHSVDVDLLPEAPIVLDVGCSGFEFDLELLKLRPKAKIYAFDPDPDAQPPKEKRIQFTRAAITDTHTEAVEWQGPGIGSYIVHQKSGYGWGPTGVQATLMVMNLTVIDVMDMRGVDHFDLVKLDCEGSEFGILSSWPGPIATQISVEFHDFIDRNRWNDAYFEKLFAGPLYDYEVKLFGLTPLGPANSLGHWDSVLVLK